MKKQANSVTKGLELLVRAAQDAGPKNTLLRDVWLRYQGVKNALAGKSVHHALPGRFMDQAQRLFDQWLESHRESDRAFYWKYKRPGFHVSDDGAKDYTVDIADRLKTMVDTRPGLFNKLMQMRDSGLYRKYHGFAHSDGPAEYPRMSGYGGLFDTINWLLAGKPTKPEVAAVRALKDLGRKVTADDLKTGPATLFRGEKQKSLDDNTLYWFSHYPDVAAGYGNALVRYDLPMSYRAALDARTFPHTAKPVRVPAARALLKAFYSAETPHEQYRLANAAVDERIHNPAGDPALALAVHLRNEARSNIDTLDHMGYSSKYQRGTLKQLAGDSGLGALPDYETMLTGRQLRGMMSGRLSANGTAGRQTTIMFPRGTGNIRGLSDGRPAEFSSFVDWKKHPAYVYEGINDPELLGRIYGYGRRTSVLDNLRTLIKDTGAFGSGKRYSEYSYEVLPDNIKSLLDSKYAMTNRDLVLGALHEAWED